MRLLSTPTISRRSSRFMVVRAHSRISRSWSTVRMSSSFCSTGSPSFSSCGSSLHFLLLGLLLEVLHDLIYANNAAADDLLNLLLRDARDAELHDEDILEDLGVAVAAPPLLRCHTPTSLLSTVALVGDVVSPSRGSCRTRRSRG